MPRFIKQRDEYSCGPVAIVNALKWAGIKATYAHVKKYKRICKTEEDMGTTLFAIHETLAATKVFKIVRLYNPPIKRIDEHIDGGGAVLFGSTKIKTEESYEGHYALIVSRSQKRYGVCNLEPPGKSYKTCCRKRFIKKFMKRFEGDKPVVWLLTARQVYTYQD